jgi:hypothetical protein
MHLADTKAGMLYAKHHPAQLLARQALEEWCKVPVF